MWFARFERVVALSMLVVLMSCSGKQKTTASEPDAAEPDVAAYVVPGTTEAAVKYRTPKRIILMIGDGMGVPAVSAAAYAKGAPLEMMQMPHVALMRTHEHEFMTTDSAASATAFATGHKTHFEGVSVKPGTTQEHEEDPAYHLGTMVQAAGDAGLKTGLVATARIVHATPAAFASNRHNRKSYEEIASDMTRSGVDVMLGAGTRFFQGRDDKRDLLEELSGQGYTIATTAAEVSEAAGSATRLVGLLHDKDMPTLSQGGRAMTLPDMTRAAIDVLDRDNPDGFFLMVEGSQIDWEEHAMDGVATIKETLDFDSAVGVARAYASQREDTLVIVTADHETGGLSLVDYDSSKMYLDVLGGLDAANAMVAKDMKGTEYADAVQFEALGGVGGALGPVQPADPRLATTFGYLSVASRGLWDSERRFSATHTATMVPLFSEGAGAELIARVHDNADLGRVVRAMILSGKAGALSPVERNALNKTQLEFEADTPRNVILLVGDGMGVASVTATYYARGELAMTQMPVNGLVATHGYDRLVNDSAATATALSIGRLARYGQVGMAGTEGGSEGALTVLERAEARGLDTGLISSTSLTHATPGSFFAHHTSRRDEAAIAQFFIDLPERIPGSDGVDVAFAGGAKYFSPEQLDVLRERGVYVAFKWEDAPAPAGQQVLRLMADKGLPPAPERLAEEAEVPALETMVSSALSTLAGGDKGFFLLVEGGQIDWAQHGLETGERLIDEVADFDRAVASALAFARERGDTLVIVTADHDHTLSLLDNHYGIHKNQCGVAKRCGGELELTEIPVKAARVARGDGFSDSKLQGEFGRPKILLQYGWLPQAARLVKKKPGPHSANFVPLFAFGPGATELAGFKKQPEIGQWLAKWADGGE